jgi:hypothetical protein
MNESIKRTSTLAIISLVSGILGWTLVPWLGSIAAIVTGHMARAEIRRESETVEGDGLAVTGLVLGYAMIGLSLLMLLLIVLFFGGLAMFLAWMGASGNLN